MFMDTPLISVIVPAYNAGQWIEECCSSVFAQTYPNWELIVVDDGSVDDTLAIAGQMALGRENVRVIHTENGGVCHARNTGLDAAQGEYIAFLDADDLLMPEALLFLYRLLRETDCDIAIGQKVNVKSDGTEIPNRYPRNRELWSGTEALIKSLEDHPATYSVWGKLYKKETIGDIRFVEGRKVHEDSFFLFQCLMKQPQVAVSDTHVLRYRISQNSASRSAVSDKLFDILYFAEEKKRLVQEYYPELEHLTMNLLVKANMALLRSLCGTCDKKYRKAEAQCLQMILENRKHFLPATQADKQWFWVITHHLYQPYKFCLCVRSQARKQTYAQR